MKNKLFQKNVNKTIGLILNNQKKNYQKYQKLIENIKNESEIIKKIKNRVVHELHKINQ